MFYYNWYYFAFMIPGILITLWAQIKMKTTFAKYENVPTMQGLTGSQAAREILNRNNLQKVQVEQVRGELTDHYDPRDKKLRLSQATYGRATIGAVGVAAHECGHAVQDEVGYLPMRLRSALVPVTNLGSALSVPLIFIGLLFSLPQLINIGIVLFSLAVVFQLVTLPVELNASRRAVNTLNDSGMVTPEESKGVQKVLTAAALTYLAGLLTSMLQLMYYVTAFGRRND